MKKVIITGPSLDEDMNVSGISSVVENILASNDVIFYHFELGKSDSAIRNWKWIVKQLSLPFLFFYRQVIFRPDITHINMPLNVLAMARDGVMVILSVFFKTKTIVHLHGGRYLKKTPSGRFLRVYLSFILLLVSKVIVLSEEERLWLINEFGISSDKITVLVNAVMIPDIPSFRAPQTLVTILFLGRIVESKGIFLLAKALHELKTKTNLKFKFLLGGTGPEVDKIVLQFKKSLGDHFSYLGVLKGVEKEKAYLMSDVFVLPSIHGEGLPMALLEAMSYGLVPVTTEDGAMAELVNAKTGFLTNKSDVQMLMSQLESAIESFETGEYCSLSIESRDIIDKKYNVKKYIKEITNIYGQA